MRWSGAEGLIAEQRRVGRLTPEKWTPSGDPLGVAAAFVAFAAGEQGPGRAGDRAWTGAVVWQEGSGDRAVAASHGLVIEAAADDRYYPGLLALREGDMLERALAAVAMRAGHLDVLMVDATGRDHPRRCGLAVHLGWALDTPSIGITHRLLTDRDRHVPDSVVGSRSLPIVLPDALEAEAAWVWTAVGVRPVVVHAGWRTDLDTAVEVALRSSAGARTPEPLRQARCLAREARSARR